jgi:hypothetical protein
MEQKLNKALNTPEMRAWFKKNDVRHEEGWYPPVELQQVTEEEYRVHMAKKKADMEARRSRLLSKKQAIA